MKTAILNALVFLARLYENTESYCCPCEVGIGVAVTLQSFKSKFFILRARHCQASYPMQGQVVLACLYETTGRAIDFTSKSASKLDVFVKAFTVMD